MSCQKSQPNPAQCRVDQAFFSSLVSGGACIIKINQQLLVMIDRKNKLYLPRKEKTANKSAQCAAHQSVWDNTGFNVEVGPRLGNLDDGIELFACELDAGFDGSESFNVPNWSQRPDNMIKFINPYEYTEYDWSKPNDHVKVLDAFVATVNTKQLFETDSDN